MDDRDSEIDVRHAFATDLRQSDLYAAAIADNSFVFDFFIFSASAFPIARRAENLLAEQAALFRLECAIVNRFGFFNLTSGPFIADHVFRRNLNGQLIKMSTLE